MIHNGSGIPPATRYSGLTLAGPFHYHKPDAPPGDQIQHVGIECIVVAADDLWLSLILPAFSFRMEGKVQVLSNFHAFLKMIDLCMCDVI